jgi:ATP-binding cassette, subfamily B, bacterial MsbA
MVFRRLLVYLRPHVWAMLGGLSLTALASVALAGYGWVIGYLTEALREKNLEALGLSLLGFLAFNMLKNAGQYFGGYTLTSVGQRVVAQIRASLFARIQYLTLPTFDTWRAGDLMSRFSNDVAVLVAGVTAVPLFASATLTLLAALTYMFYLNWQLTLVTLAVAPIVSYVVYRFSGLLRRVTNTALSRVADLNSSLAEALESMRIIKAFTRESYEVRRFNDRNEANFGASMKLAQVALTQTPVIDFVVMLGVLALAGFAFYQIVLGRLSIAAFVQFLTLAGVAANPIAQLSNYTGDLNKAYVAAKRIFEIIDLPVEESDAPGKVRLTDIRGAVEFSDVRFAYDGFHDILKGVSAKVDPGEIVALVGPSGAGKTTLVNLIPRFYEPTGGAVLVDGHDIAQVTLSSLRGAIAIVPQDPQLFSDTIEQNIRYGRLEASTAEVIAAARQANAHDFIAGFPDGYQTLVGTRGLRLSGGERQRIAIARALLRDPRILILDEATSSLDANSEALINEALDHLLVGRTTFIIAHRLSTIRRAGTILVIVDGKIAERGTHDQLLSRGALYAELYEKQVSPSPV